MPKSSCEKMVLQVYAILFASVLISACSPIPVPTSASLPTTPTGVFIKPTLLIKSPESISVQIDGMGLNGKKNFSLDLKRTDHQFTGFVSYSFSDWLGFATSEQEAVAVPADVVATFIATLQSTPLDNKPYLPPPTVPDAYGSTWIRIYSESQTVSFYNSAPLSPRWRITVYDEKPGSSSVPSPYAAESVIPYNAMDVLKPYQKPELEQKIINKLIEERNRKTTPIPKTP
ncbi:hypothetical protein ANRL1_04704 [Anaerolineae bacterium]|nr:hypothetical protein ANRL1_04704 [Anaerolineae bacterium]